MLVINCSLREWFLQLSVSRGFTGRPGISKKRSINSDSSFHVCFSQRSKLNRQRTFYRKRRGPRDHKHRGSAYGVSLATIICLLAFSSDTPLRCNVVCILAAMRLITSTFPHYRFVSLSLFVRLHLHTRTRTNT